MKSSNRYSNKGSKDSRRFFSVGEKVALWLAADGKCESCGEALGADWEADHIQPFSKDGITDVINGAALCKTCNRRKGSEYDDLLNPDCNPRHTERS